MIFEHKYPECNLLEYKHSAYKLLADQVPENKQHKNKLLSGKHPGCNFPEDKNSDKKNPPPSHYPSPFHLTPFSRLTI